MKKVFLILTLVTFGIVNAQKGTILVGGNFSYKSVKNPVDEFYFQAPGGGKTTTFEFSPKVGYQFSNSFTVGIEASYGKENRTDMSTASINNGQQFVTPVDVEISKFNLGAFLRYSKTFSGPFSAYADLSSGMISGKATRTLLGLPGENKYNGFYAGITPAVAIDLKKNLLLNFSFGGVKYSSVKSEFFDSNSTSSLEFDFGKQISIGISKNF